MKLAIYASLESILDSIETDEVLIYTGSATCEYVGLNNTDFELLQEDGGETVWLCMKNADEEKTYIVIVDGNPVQCATFGGSFPPPPTI